jgi:hypothetical protein
MSYPVIYKVRNTPRFKPLLILAIGLATLLLFTILYVCSHYNINESFNILTPGSRGRNKNTKTNIYMSTIINLHKLAGLLPEADLKKLETGATMHLHSSNISFKIIKVYNDEIHVRTEQGKHLSENYADIKVLITRTRELFERFFPGKTIYTHPVPFNDPIVNVVTPAWIQKEMLFCKIKVKDFVGHTGIDKSNFYAWINGLRPMSQIVKAMIFNIVQQYAIKRFINFLNEDVEYGASFSIKKHFDKEVILSLLYSNKNAARYDIKLTENDKDYWIHLGKKEKA